MATERATAAQRRRGGLAAQEARRRRESGAVTGWHQGTEWRLGGYEAMLLAIRLEAAGWRAEAIHLAQGAALIEVRDWHRRPHPLVAVLRTAGEAEAFLAQVTQEARR